MRSTFMGLEASKRGLFTQQSALYTTGHNIANANTQGYSRQRVNMQPTLGYPGTGLNAPKTPGFIGTGVETQSVQRIRDGFIDTQFRQETNKLGYWESRSQAISQMEDILSEPSEFGLNESLDQFWKSLQDLSTNPEKEARNVVVQRGIAVAESFNYITSQLDQIKGNLGNQIGVNTTKVNSILEQIAELNGQIGSIEPNGYIPNDLYDARDTLIDELNKFYPVITSNTPSGGNAVKGVAEGIVTVSLKLKDGSTVELVNGKIASQIAVNPVGINNTPSGPVTGITVTSPTLTSNVDVSNMSDTGEMKSLINSFGYDIGGGEQGYYPEMIANLNKMALEFATEFNRVHALGQPLPGETKENDFFEFTAGSEAATLKVRDIIVSDPGLINASSAINEEGNGANAKLLSNVKSAPLGGLGNATVQSFYQGIIGKLGVDGEYANRTAYNADTIRLTVANNRAAVSSVSLDEEMTNMITFQQAYNASARMITVVDETLDKIINGMGRVGI